MLGVDDQIGGAAGLVHHEARRPRVVGVFGYEAIAVLVEYDQAHETSLVRTLEEFLARRGTISATAAALYIHPNTLRQRLRRIMELTGLDLRREDWLMVEIAVKLAALERALHAEANMSAAARM